MPHLTALTPSAAAADWLHQRQHDMESALSHWVAPQAPADLQATMRYAVLDGGKRLRPLLVLASHEAVMQQHPQLAASQVAVWHDTALRAACAVELIHAYSLVHDDMPCMDNDQMRRGKPTTHVQFGEAAALLAGDAMQALAFELLTPLAEETGTSESDLTPPATQAALCAILARAAGHRGMAGGQAIDLAHVGKRMTQAALQHMHTLKTGALLQASVRMGCHCAPHANAHPDPRLLAALVQYGDAIGLAFQVVDDVLDATADSATLGKTAGKDAANDKPTYVSLMGIEAAQTYATQLHQQAMQALEQTGLPDTRILVALADMVIQRRY